MKYLSLFSGIGGFELGIQQALPEAECIGYSEIDKHAKKIYQQHFPTRKDYGDVTKISPSTLPNFDLLVGGFPCQAFSIAGKRGGFEDTRGTLFLKSHGFLPTKNPNIFYSKTLKVYLAMTVDVLCKQSLGFSPKQVMSCHGVFIIRKIMEYHSHGNECTLSDILEADVSERYYLSAQQQKRLLNS